MDSFFTIKDSAEGMYKEKGSKFFAYAYHVNTIDEVKTHLEDLKKEHFKSRHNCFAYRIGVSGDTYRANDDGEPSGTAGVPILNALKSKELVNVVVFVVRYFGGTKLGVPGLIRAYKSAALDAIEHTTIVEDFMYEVYKLEFGFSEMGNIMSYVNQGSWKIIDQSYDNDPFLKLRVKASDAKAEIANLKSKINGFDVPWDYKVQDDNISLKHIETIEGLM